MESGNSGVRLRAASLDEAVENLWSYYENTAALAAAVRMVARAASRRPITPVATRLPLDQLASLAERIELDAVAAFEQLGDLADNEVIEVMLNTEVS